MKYKIAYFILLILLNLLFAASSAIAQSEAFGDKYKTAVFAGGCFWCMEKPYDELGGVISTISGYTGGHKKNPTYQEVSSGTTGHIESIRITYDTTKITYKDLLEVFWKNIDPLDPRGQFCDKGPMYVSAIFYSTEEEKKLSEESLKNVQTKFKQNIATRLIPATVFYPAEDYHQNYYQNNPIKYKYYRYRCGRDARLDDLWGK